MAAMVAGAAIGAAGIAGATGSSTTTYTACLGGGVFYNANTTGTTPTCKRGDAVVSWNAQGPTGPAGVDGKTIRYGAGAPDNSLGNDGDFYIDTSSHFIYGPKSGGSWPTGTSLVGPQGVPGQSGTDGKTILNGSGAPTSDLGSDGDFYLDTVGEVLYGPKANGAWPVSGTSLVGPKGDTGLTGATGPAGDVGASGAVGTGDLTISRTTWGAPSGPSTIAKIGSSGTAIVTLTAQMAQTDDGKSCFMSFMGGGIYADDSRALRFTNSSHAEVPQLSATFWITGIWPGSQGFSAVYRVDGGTCQFANENIIVVPAG